MTPPGKRLVSLLALLPDGLGGDQLDALLPEAAGDAAAALRRTGLGGRLAGVAEQIAAFSLPPLQQVAKLGQRLGVVRQ